jgi:hypothetical protein
VTKVTAPSTTGGHATNTTPSATRTVLAGIAGGLAFVLGNFLTFGLLGGSRRGHQGLLFNPDTQSPKVIIAWKILQPLPRIIDTRAHPRRPFMFGIGYALLFRSIAPAWPPGRHQRSLRLALIVWLGPPSQSSWGRSTYCTSP